jgi:hypothetical protein
LANASRNIEKVLMVVTRETGLKGLTLY